MWIDLLKASPSSTPPSRRLRRAVALGVAVYLGAIAAPQLSLVVHHHAGDDRTHTHHGVPIHPQHGFASDHHHDGDHHHHGDHQGGDAHHEHGDDDHHHGGEHGQVARHRHGDDHDHDGPHHAAAHRRARHDAAAAASEATDTAPQLRLDDFAHRAHWHDQDSYNLATLQLAQLLTVTQGRRLAAPASPRTPRLTIAQPTRARGPPLCGSALVSSEI